MMTQEEYQQLEYEFVHCAGSHCEKAAHCMRHLAYEQLADSKRDRFTLANPAVITGAQPCPLYEPDRKERFAWGISHIYDNVRASDLRGVRLKVMSCFGSSTYYQVKRMCRAITEEEQQLVRQSFDEMGYDGKAIEFDRYEEQYPALMRLIKFK